MITIVTVHGTNAGNLSDTGPQWWQLRSEFQSKLDGYIEAEDVQFFPFHWNGENSEFERRKAGNDLRRKLLRLEHSGEDYALIGHSHGGSVIHHALFSAFAKRKPLKGLKSWITVGTPFIALDRTSFFLSRYNIIGQITFFATIAAVIGVVDALNVGLRSGNLSTYGEIFSGSANFQLFSTLNLLIPPLVSLATVLGVLFIVRSYTARARKRSSQKHQAQFLAEYMPRFAALFHPGDEAISALSGAKNIEPQIIPFPAARNALRNALLFFSALLAIAHFVLRSPVSYDVGLHPEAEEVALPNSEEDKMCIVEWRGRMFYHAESATRSFLSLGGVKQNNTQQRLAPCKRTNRDDPFHFVPNEQELSLSPLRTWERFLILPGVIDRLITQYTNQLSQRVSGTPSGPFTMTITKLLSGPGMFVYLGMLAWGLAFVISNTIVRAGIFIANSGLAQRLRDIAYGNDTLGETVSGVHDRFSDMEEEAWKPLPEDLASEIEQFTEQYALDAIRRIRAFVSSQSNASGAPIESEFAELLTWKELIHTAYFDVDNFVKLIAVVLANSEIVNLSDALKGDQMIDRVKAIHSEIRP